MSWISNKQIIIPIDLTDFSAQGIRTSMEMADDPENQLTIVYVLPPLESYDPGVHWESLNYVDRTESTKRSVALFLERNGLPALKIKILFGDPGREIVHYANQEKIGLIVIPSHTRGTLSRWLLGSVTDYVLHHAPCPVLFLKRENSSR
ncbi:MAG: universal stress protein [Planctomycetia bacterium]|nr:universal stress protein [Planctomycetia bacterium]